MNKQTEIHPSDYEAYYEAYQGIEVSNLNRWVQFSRFVSAEKFAMLVLAAILIYGKLSDTNTKMTIICITILGLTEIIKYIINHAKTKKRRSKKPIEP